MKGQLEMFTKSTTLEEARARLREGVREGTWCPCCDRWAMRAGMETGYYVDITTAPAWLLRSNQLATLRWWGLIERAPNDDPKKKSSGMWALTNLGRHFIRGNVAVPRRVCTLFGDVVDQSDDTITVHDIQHHFDYMEVLRGE